MHYHKDLWTYWNWTLGTGHWTLDTRTKAGLDWTPLDWRWKLEPDWTGTEHWNCNPLELEPSGTGTGHWNRTLELDIGDWNRTEDWNWKGSLRLAMNRCKVMLRWVPAHKGLEGNEVADCWAKVAAKGEEGELRRVEREMSLAHVKRRTSEERQIKTKRWIQEKLKGTKNYILRKKEGMRQVLNMEKKGVAARYYQLMTGHVVIAPYLKNKLKKRDSEDCWWCGSGRCQTREHLFKKCAQWKEQIKELWRNVGRDTGWRRAKWRSIAELFREERAEGAVLNFIWKTGVGRMSGGVSPKVEQEDSEAESEAESEA
jgi:hypothetical protein